jgi:hypothetical protein
MIDYEKVSVLNIKDVEESIYMMSMEDRERAIEYYRFLEEQGNLKELSKSEFFPRWFFETMNDKRH